MRSTPAPLLTLLALHIDEVVDHARRFLKAHQPALARYPSGTPTASGRLIASPPSGIFKSPRAEHPSDRATRCALFACSCGFPDLALLLPVPDNVDGATGRRGRTGR